MLKVDGAVGDLRARVFRRGDVGLLIEHLLDALHRGGGLGDHDEHHGEHHQAHQDVHDVGKQARQLARGQPGAPDDHLRAEPADEQDAGIDAAHHDRVAQGHDALGGDGVVVEVVGGMFEFVVLVLLAHERLDHADGADVLLDDGVDDVVLAEHLPEVAHGLRDEHEQHHAKHRHDDQKDHGELRVDGKRHEQRDDERHGGAGEHHEHHLEGVLHVAHVGGHAGDQAGGGEAVDVGERERLDVFEHVLAQVAGEARARAGAVLPGLDAADSRQQRHDQHLRADDRDAAHVAHGDALVDDGGGLVGDQDFQDDAQDGEQRGEQRVLFVLADLSCQPKAGHSFFLFLAHRFPP